MRYKGFPRVDTLGTLKTEERIDRGDVAVRLTSEKAPRDPCHHLRPCGCESATDHIEKRSCCLTCPFSECVFDVGGKRFLKTEETETRIQRFDRDQAIIRCYEWGWDVWKLAEHFDLSQRSIFRILAET